MGNHPYSDTELDDLLSRMADGVLDGPGEKRLAEILRSSPEARRSYLEYVAMVGGLEWEYGDAASAAEAPPAPASAGQPRPGPAWWRRLVVPAAAAAALAVAGVAIYEAVGTRDQAVATLDFTDGPVTWFAASGGEGLDLAGGAPLPAGRLHLEGESASAQVRFDDGTTLTLTGETEFSFAAEPAKRIQLHRGRIAADVTPQPEGNPLRVTTATAVIEVLGTVFSVNAAGEQTSVGVDHGLVRVRRLADGQTVEVPSQHRTLATLDTTAALAPAPAEPLPIAWESDLRFRAGEVSRGRVVLGDPIDVVHAEPYIASHKPDGTKVVRYGICFKNAVDEFFDLVEATADSVLLVRFRGYPAGPNVFISLHQPDGRFGGNFEFDIPSSETVPDSDGWCTYEIALLDFTVLAALEGRGFTTAGNRIAKVLVSSHAGQALEISEISVRPR